MRLSCFLTHFYPFYITRLEQIQEGLENLEEFLDKFCDFQ